MGKACCGTPGKHTYEFNGKKQVITTKNSRTVERFAHGASARIAVKQKRVELAKEIAGKCHTFLYLLITFYYIQTSNNHSIFDRSEEAIAGRAQ